MKMKFSQVQKGMAAFEKDEHYIAANFEANKDASRHKIPPITVSYSNPNADKGDFKFIQSVNIINGYNVSLSDTPGKNNA